MGFPPGGQGFPGRIGFSWENRVFLGARASRPLEPSWAAGPRRKGWASGGLSMAGLRPGQARCPRSQGRRAAPWRSGSGFPSQFRSIMVLASRHADLAGGAQRARRGSGGRTRSGVMMKLLSNAWTVARTSGWVSFPAGTGGSPLTKALDSCADIIKREAAKPRSREAAKPRSREARSREAAKPRSREAAKPRSREAAKPRSREAAKPRSREAAKPRSREAAKPRSREAAKPRSREAAKPRSREAAKPRSPFLRPPSSAAA